MTPNPTIMTAVEKLGYRVTSGDVAVQAGMDVNVAQQQLLALASDAGGHLQVAESGEIAFQFPKNFRAVLRNKFWRLKWQEWWQKVWRILFYLIRISFGLLLIASIVLIFVSIMIIMMALNSSRDDDSGGGNSGGSGMIFMPRFWFSPDLFWFFYWDYGSPSYQRQQRTRSSQRNQINFLEAVFSFLFGDGNPNANLEERRWQSIATVIRNNQGAVIGEQIAPYLDQIRPSEFEYEDYMLPVLTQFNGRPEVSPEGELVYHFPDLQTTAVSSKPQPVSSYLKEKLWRFSQASSGQLILAGGLGVVNIVGAVILGALLREGTIAQQIGGLVAFVDVIYPLLFGYGIGFLLVPLVRYLWLKGRNAKVENRNQQRQERAIALNQADQTIQQKLNYARQFTAEMVIKREDLAYTTETDLIEQELEQSEKIDQEWQKRLNESN